MHLVAESANSQPCDVGPVDGVLRCLGKHWYTLDRIGERR
jgi:hypothetical protein